MKVGQAMTREVKTCRIDDPLSRAAQVLWEHDCGCVPVLDEEDGVAGVLTDRDICMAAYTQGRRLDELTAPVAMSKTVWHCRPEDSLSTAEELMREKQVRRLPVLDASGRLVGILSLNDLARLAAGDRMQKMKAVSDAEVAETLSAICIPRLPAEQGHGGARVTAA